MGNWERHNAFKSGNIAILPDVWGEDHWSTLLYAETRDVDFDSNINYLNMRCDPTIHPDLVHAMAGGEYPTRLYGGRTVERHDDYSCLEDMQVAGLLVLEYYVVNGRRGLMRSNGNRYSARVSLTDKGWRWAGRLRKHKGRGGKTRDFSMDHILGLDEEAVKVIASQIELTALDIDEVMEQFGFEAGGPVTPDDLEEKLLEHAGVQACASCGFWCYFAETYSEYCGDCDEDYNQEYYEEDCDDADLYDEEDRC